MLELHSRCLKKLEQKEEYARMMLRLLAKFAAYSQAQLTKKAVAASMPLPEQELLAGYVTDLFEVSGAVQKDVSASLTDFFADLRVDPSIRLYDDKDGFQMQLSLRFLLGQQIDIDAIKVRLVSANNAQNSEHWFESSTEFVVKSSSTKILIDSSVSKDYSHCPVDKLTCPQTTLQGKYFVDRLEMRAGNIIFTFCSGNHSALPIGFRETGDAQEAEGRPYIYCYRPANGLQAKIVSPHLINLEAMRTLELELNSGRNDIQTGTIRVRPATAGLRLRIAEAEVVEGELEVVANHESGVIEFAQLPPQSFVRLRVPYTVEEAFSSLSARAEIGYETLQGRFAFSSMHSVVATLPISVNVQDIFKDETLFSRFIISPGTLTPLRITNCNLPSSEGYDVHSSITGPVALDVFPKQPASLLYKICPHEGTAATPAAQRALRLRVDFTCVDDECLDAIEKRFAAAIDASPFRGLAALLTSHLVSSFRTQLSTAEMEVIGLVREIEMLPYQSVRWDELLGALPVSREDVRQWLMAWHKVCSITSRVHHSLIIYLSGKPYNPSPHPPLHRSSPHHHPCRGSRDPGSAHRRAPASQHERPQLHARSRERNDHSRTLSTTHAPLVLPIDPGTRRPTAGDLIRATRQPRHLAPRRAPTRQLPRTRWRNHSFHRASSPPETRSSPPAGTGNPHIRPHFFVAGAGGTCG